KLLAVRGAVKSGEGARWGLWVVEEERDSGPYNLRPINHHLVLPPHRREVAAGRATSQGPGQVARRLHDPRQRDAGLNAEPVEHDEAIFGREVSRRARRVGASAAPP